MAFSLLTPRSSRWFGSRGLRFLSICLDRRNFGRRPPRPCWRCSLTLRIVTGITWFVLLLGRGVFLGRGSSRAGRKLRLLRQHPFVCGSLGWNSGIIVLLFNRLDTFPSGGFLESWSRVGMILVRDGCVPGSSPGSYPRGTRFLCCRGSGLILLRRRGCGSPTGYPGGGWIRRDIRCPTGSAYNFTSGFVGSLWWPGLLFCLSCGGSRSSSWFRARCKLAGAL
jgi:hypothetical protein